MANRIARLRSAILRKVIQHPFTLLPLGAAAASGAWALLSAPHPATLVGLAGGCVLGILGGVFNLAYNGPAIRDGVLAQWESEAEMQEDQNKAQLRQELQSLDNASDILALFDRLEHAMEDVEHTFDSGSVGPANTDLFRPIVEQNHKSALAILQRLAFVQRRLANLLASSGYGDTSYPEKVSLLRDQRAKFIAHLREVIEALERTAHELPRLYDVQLDAARRDLDELERSLEVARTTYQKMKETSRPISGLHLRPDLRPRHGSGRMTE